ncbi:HAMP domain-containing histidine kinase [bacterium]|nr:HAMP domain-containing histidine kinase [bacterium]
MQALVPGRGSRIALPFAGLFALLAVAISGIAVWLVGRTVEDRIHEQLKDTARLITGAHYRFSDATVSQIANYIHAEVVVVVGKKVQATSLDAPRARELERALESGALALPGKDVEIREAAVGADGALVAAAPLEPRGEGSALFLLYPRELVAQERARATRPVLVLSVIGVLLAAVLGAWKERSVVRERTQALERLVSALAHEVKNPLGAIKLTAETLRDAVSSERDREAIDVVAGEVDRLSLLVDELRLLGGGRRPFEPRAVLPGEAVDSVLALLRRTLEHRGLTIEKKEEGGALARAVRVDPRALKQALLNLLLNAIEASPTGGRVALAVSLRERSVRFLVTDEGPGVAASVRDRIFEPFVTTKEGGTGLGLALARLVAIEHGGTLACLDSQRGAALALELPLAS